MSNAPTAPTAPASFSQDDCPTEVLPIVAPAPAPTRRPERGPFAGWRDRTPTEELPVAPTASLGPDAASTARMGAGTHACHTSAAPSTGPEQAPSETPLQDMGRPGILARPSMRWHPSLMQLAIGAAIVAALLGACNVAAINAHRAARAYCHALVVSDWERAERECRGTGAGTPVPEQVPTAPAQPEQAASPQPEQPSTPASPSSKAVWTVHGTDSPYDRTDPLASPLDLPRCTTAPDTPMPCLAHISNDSHHVTVLEEDASLTGLDRR